MVIRLLIFGLVLFAVIFFVLRHAGMKSLAKDYDKEYNDLNSAVKNYKVCRRNYDLLKRRFIRISQYRCRDKEKLDVLYRQFCQKYIQL